MHLRSHPKLVFVVALAVLTAIFFWIWLQRYIISPKAAQSTVSVTMTPSSGDITVGEENVVDIILQTQGQTGISGIDLTVDVAGLSLLDIGNPTPVDPGSSVVFTELISEIPVDGNTGRHASVLIEPDEKLPKTVRYQVVFRGSASGQCSIAVNTANTTVVGNVDGNSYSFANGAKAVFNCKPVVAEGPTVDALFQPSLLRERVGNSLTTSLILQSRQVFEGISGFDLDLRFDPKVVEVVDINEPIDTGPPIVISPFPTQPQGQPTPTVPAGGSCQKDSECAIPDCRVDSSGATVCPEVKCINNQCLVNPNGIVCHSDQDCPQPCADPNGPSCLINKCINNKCQFPTTVVNSIKAQLAQNNFTKLKKDWDNALGTGKIVYVVIDSDENLPRRPTLDITLLCKAKGSGTLSFSKSQIVGNIAGDQYNVIHSFANYTCDAGGVVPTISVSPGPTSHPDPTTVPGTTVTPPEGRVRVGLKLQFQGIVSKPDDRYNNMTVRCQLGDGPLKAPVESSGQFVADANGVWTGSLAYDVPPGSGYKILCKGPKHLRKKVCAAAPTETYPGTYACDKGAITLKEGDNNFDFSDVVHLAGDLPDRDSGAQDGVVTAYDIAFIRNSFDKSDDVSLRVGDLNLDGRVNAIDHAIVVASLETRADEQ